MPIDEIKMEEGGGVVKPVPQRDSGFCGSPEVVQIIQKVHTYLHLLSSTTILVSFR